MENRHPAVYADAVLSARITGWSFGLLALSIVAFASSDFVKSQQATLPTVPLPAPNADVVMYGHASVSGTYQLWVDVPAPNSAFGLGISEDDPPLKCVITVSAMSRSGGIKLARSILRPAAEYSAGKLKIYSSAAFQLSRGDFSILVSNEGCASPDAFRGGIAYLHHPAPVIISVTLLAKALGYISAFLVMLLLAYGTIVHQARRHPPH